MKKTTESWDAPVSSLPDCGEVGHLVQFYDEDSYLLESVTRFLGTALGAGDAAVAIATRPHLDLLEAGLAARGLDVGALRSGARLVVLDAAGTLERFLVDGQPDEARFGETVGGVIARTLDRHRRLRAFGEMVALLYADGRPEAAIRLEQLWNRLAQKHAFSLLCAYPIRTFAGDREDDPFLGVCAQHSLVIPAESYLGLPAADARARKISELQRKAHALEIETAERKTAERELRVKVEMLAAIDRRKDEFLAMLGHELRNPLAAVRNAIVTARLDPSRRGRALDIAARQADQLARLVDDLLDVARITQGQVTLRRQRIAFVGAVERAIETARPFIEERAHALTVSLPDEDLPVEADSTRLEQIVVNLLNNAAKYTDPGGRIVVTVERQEEEAVLRVADNGVGISAEMLPRVFDLFAQADRDLDRALGGLGVGLTVARRLAELHEGRVDAFSRGPGTGSEFVLRLPLDRAARRGASAAAATARNAGAARILVVEDNVDAAESLVMLLELVGHQVRAVHDGPAALEAAKTDAPDVMLVDIGLPGMDGYEVARRVRRDPSLRGTTLVALTGYGRDEDRERAIAAGFDHHLVKPIDPEALQRLVVGVEEPAAAGDESPTVH